MNLFKYVESRLFVSSGLGKIGVYSPQFLVYPFTQNTIVLLMLPYLYIDRN